MDFRFEGETLFFPGFGGDLRKSQHYIDFHEFLRFLGQIFWSILMQFKDEIPYFSNQKFFTTLTSFLTPFLAVKQEGEKIFFPDTMTQKKGREGGEICWKFFLATRKFFLTTRKFFIDDPNFFLTTRNLFIDDPEIFLTTRKFLEDRKFLVNEVKFHDLSIVSLKSVLCCFLIVFIGGSLIGGVQTSHVIVVRDKNQYFLVKIGRKKR